MTVPVAPAAGSREDLERPSLPRSSSQRPCRITTLYREHSTAILTRCQRLLGDGAAAEDATHEVFCRAHRHLAQVPEGPAAVAWLSRVATNLCLNQLRDRRRRGHLLSLEARSDASVYGPPDELGNRVHVRWLLDRVPEEVRTTAWLRHVEDLEQQEIADFLGISRRTVVYRLASFRQAARRPGRPA